MWPFEKKEEPRKLDTVEEKLYIVDTIDKNRIITDKNPLNVGGVYKGMEYFTRISKNSWDVEYYYKGQEIHINVSNICTVRPIKRMVLCDYEYEHMD